MDVTEMAREFQEQALRTGQIDELPDPDGGDGLPADYPRNPFADLGPGPEFEALRDQYDALHTFAADGLHWIALRIPGKPGREELVRKKNHVKVFLEAYGVERKDIEARVFKTRPAACAWLGVDPWAPGPDAGADGSRELPEVHIDPAMPMGPRRLAPTAERDPPSLPVVRLRAPPPEPPRARVVSVWAAGNAEFSAVQFNDATTVEPIPEIDTVPMTELRGALIAIYRAIVLVFEAVPPTETTVHLYTPNLRAARWAQTNRGTGYCPNPDILQLIGKYTTGEYDVRVYHDETSPAAWEVSRAIRP